MKRYDNDPAKERSRMMLKDMIEGTLLKFMKPQDIRVLHLPGPDGMEYKQVYAPLGIPPENVIGIEQKERFARMAQESNPGTKIITTSLEDYVAKNPNLNQEVISIDTTRNLSQNSLNNLMTLIMGVKAKNYVFHLGFQKRRENKRSRHFLQHLAAHVELNHILSSLSPLEGRKEGLEGLRDMALSYIVQSATGGIPYTQANAVMQAMLGPSYDAAVEYSLRRLEKLDPGGDPTGAVERKILAAKDPFVMEDLPAGFMFHMHTYASIRIHGIMQMQIKQILPFKSQIKLEDEAQIFAKKLTDAITFRHMKRATFAYKLRKYAYVSESGAPMIGDIAYFRSNTTLYQAYSDFLDQFEPRTFAFRDVSKAAKYLIKIANLLDSNPLRETTDFMFDREFLGSSAKPVIRKAGAKGLLLQGLTPAQIKATHRGMSIMQIAAIKAHITMGTYDEREDLSDAQSRAELRRDLEAKVALAQEGVKLEDIDSIDRADCISYLSAGIPPREIHEAFRGTSLPKIIAWDYWRREGKYAEAAK